MSLKKYGLQINDYVIYPTDKTGGGIVYQIIFEQEPIKVCETVKLKLCKVWDASTRSYVEKEAKVYGLFDASGNEIKIKESVVGYVRIKPVYTLFITSKQKREAFSKKGLLVSYKYLNHLTKVTLEMLGSKYVELGELMKTIAQNYASEN